MSLLQMIQEEHSKAQREKIVRYIGNDKKRFAALMKIFLQGEYRDVQRAAWPLSYCVREHPELVQPWFKQLLDMLGKPHTHNAVQRNITRLLQDVTIPKRYQGQVMDACFRFIEQHDTPVAIKAFSLTVLENLSKDYPEILPEIKLLIEERWEHETAAFQSRARKILKKL